LQFVRGVVVINERRDYRSRAAAVHRILERLSAERGGVRLERWQDEGLPATAAERILKRLAIRGLVRIAEGCWVARRVLLAGAAVQVTEAA
jgi:hypothetical protein